MSMFFRLTGIQLRQRFGLSALKTEWKTNRRRSLLQILVFLVAGLSIAFVVGLYTSLLASMIPAMLQIGLGTLLIGCIFLLSMIMTLVMGFLYQIGVLYFSKDIEYLAALPIPQRTVFASKFFQVYTGEMAVSCLLLAPALIIYGIATGGSFLYWLRALLMLALSPCIPLTLSGLLSLLLMRITALWRHRDRVSTIAAALALILYFVGQSWLSARLSDEMALHTIISLLKDHAGVLERVISAFPPSAWAARGLLQGGGQLPLFCACSLIALGAVLLLSSRLYYQGAMAQLETFAAKKRSKKAIGAQKRRSAMFAMFLREWRYVLRTPVYALNGLISIVMGPLLMALPLFYQLDASTGLDLLSLLVDPYITAILLAGVFLVIGTLNPAASTCMSREGKNYYMLRLIPASPERQIYAKFLFGYCVSFLTMLLMAVSVCIFMKISAAVSLAALGISLVGSIAPIALSIIPDVIRPKLIWNSETEAIKQNLNAVLGMLIGWAYIALLGVCFYWLHQTQLSFALCTSIILLISIILDGASLYALGRAARATWRRVEG